MFLINSKNDVNYFCTTQDQDILSLEPKVMCISVIFFLIYGSKGTNKNADPRVSISFVMAKHSLEPPMLKSVYPTCIEDCMAMIAGQLLMYPSARKRGKNNEFKS